jgi:hypothetical protein
MERELGSDYSYEQWLLHHEFDPHIGTHAIYTRIMYAIPSLLYWSVGRLKNETDVPSVEKYCTKQLYIQLKSAIYIDHTRAIRGNSIF